MYMKNGIAGQELRQS